MRNEKDDTASEVDVTRRIDGTVREMRRAVIECEQARAKLKHEASPIASRRGQFAGL